MAHIYDLPSFVAARERKLQSKILAAAEGQLTVLHPRADRAGSRTAIWPMHYELTPPK